MCLYQPVHTKYVCAIPHSTAREPAAGGLKQLIARDFQHAITLTLVHFPQKVSNGGKDGDILLSSRVRTITMFRTWLVFYKLSIVKMFFSEVSECSVQEKGKKKPGSARVICELSIINWGDFFFIVVCYFAFGYVAYSPANQFT